MKNPLLLIVALVLCVSCQNGNIELDNSGKTPLKVIVDGTEHMVAAGQTKSIKLESGKHGLTIKSEFGEKIEQASIDVVNGGLVNLAKGKYVIWRDLYGPQTLKDEHLKEDWHEIGGREYFADLETLENDDFFIEQSWDFGLKEKFPRKRYTLDRPKKEEYYVKAKLFRIDDFVKEYTAMAD